MAASMHIIILYDIARDNKCRRTYYLPHIGLHVDRFVVQYFGSHVVGRAEYLSHVGPFAQVPGYAEVT